MVLHPAPVGNASATFVGWVCVICIAFIFLYGRVVRDAGCGDLLATPIFDHPILQSIDGWSLAHAALFAFLGWMVPRHHLAFLSLGYIWEVIETYLGQVEVDAGSGRIVLVGGSDGAPPTAESGEYWYGKESDVIMNIAGYSIGSYFATRAHPLVCV